MNAQPSSDGPRTTGSLLISIGRFWQHKVADVVSVPGVRDGDDLRWITITRVAQVKRPVASVYVDYCAGPATSSPNTLTTAQKQYIEWLSTTLLHRPNR